MEFMQKPTLIDDGSEPSNAESDAEKTAGESARNMKRRTGDIPDAEMPASGSGEDQLQQASEHLTPAPAAVSEKSVKFKHVRMAPY